jgi:hypothetical protein
MMEEFKKILKAARFPQALQILGQEKFGNGNFILSEIKPAKRVAMAKAAHRLLHPGLCFHWPEEWCQEPRFPAVYCASNQERKILSQ